MTCVSQNNDIENYDVFALIPMPFYICA